MIWPFPLIRIYETDRVLTELFLDFARTEFEVVKNSAFDLHLRGPMGEIRCWNTNRWYAWASDGTFTPANSAEAAIVWRKRMPSRWAVRKMVRAVNVAEALKFRAVERGEIALDLEDYAHSGYVVRRPHGGAGATTAKEKP